MLFIQSISNFILFSTGLFGILYNKRGNLIRILICFEILLLASSLNFVMFSVYLDTVLGELMALFILTVAAAESAIGLAIVILYSRHRGNIYIIDDSVIRS